jgi:hypothetical protein
MYKYLLYYFIIIITFVFCSDPSSANKPDPPESLKMIDKILNNSVLADTTLNEPGIDAIPDNDAILVAWHPYTGSNRIKKFKIYRSSDAQGLKNYNMYDDIDIENNFSQDTTFLDNNVTLYQYYYYFVTVVDEDNQESPPSDTLRYQLLDKAIANQPAGNTYVPGDTIEFKFFIPQETFANGYILRIERQIGQSTTELVHIEYVNPRPDFGVTDASRLIMTSIFPVRTVSVEYRWRVDVIAGDILSEGSESNWAFFTVNWGN